MKMTAFSLEFKYRILKEVEEGKLSKTQICQKHGIKKSTLSTMLKDKAKIEASVLSSSFQPSRKRMRLSKLDNAEHSLTEWVKNQTTRGEHIPDQRLKAKANDFAAQFGLDFTASSGWLQRFKARLGICQKRLSGSPSAEHSETFSHNAGDEECQIKMKLDSDSSLYDSAVYDAVSEECPTESSRNTSSEGVPTSETLLIDKSDPLVSKPDADFTADTGNEECNIKIEVDTDDPLYGSLAASHDATMSEERPIESVKNESHESVPAPVTMLIDKSKHSTSIHDDNLTVNAGCEASGEQTQETVSEESPAQASVPNTERLPLKRSAFSIEFKYRVLKEVEEGKLSKTQICQKHGIKKSTLSNMLKDKAKIEASVLSSSFKPSRKKMRLSKLDNAEHSLTEWVKNQTSKGEHIPDQRLKAKAKYFADEIGLGFTATSGWLQRFKARLGICQSQRQASSQKSAASFTPGRRLQDNGECKVNIEVDRDDPLNEPLTVVFDTPKVSEICAAESSTNHRREYVPSSGPLTLDKFNHKISTHDVDSPKHSPNAGCETSKEHNQETASEESSAQDSIPNTERPPLTRTAFSLEFKYRILKEVEEGKLSKTQICQIHKIKKSTLSNMLKDKAKIEASVLSSSFQPSRKKMRLSKLDNAEHSLTEWVKNHPGGGGDISDQRLMAKANDFAAQFGVDFTANAGWLQRFKARYGICQKGTSGIPAAEILASEVDVKECKIEIDDDSPHNGQLLFVQDAAVPEGVRKGVDLGFSRGTLPSCLGIGKSNIPGAGWGIFATQSIAARTSFGPYGGIKEVTTKTESAEDSWYCWQIFTDGQPSHLVNAKDPSRANWMRYVNFARSEGEQNLAANQDQGEIYFCSTRPIPLLSELLVNFGETYAKDVRNAKQRVGREWRQPDIEMEDRKYFDSNESPDHHHGTFSLPNHILP